MVLRCLNWSDHNHSTNNLSGRCQDGADLRVFCIHVPVNVVIQFHFAARQLYGHPRSRGCRPESTFGLLQPLKFLDYLEHLEYYVSLPGITETVSCSSGALSSKFSICWAYHLIPGKALTPWAKMLSSTVAATATTIVFS